MRGVTLLLPNGDAEHLDRLGDTEGFTSTRFGNSRYIVKLGDDPELMRREACVLRRLAGGDAVPVLVCAADFLIVMENAGTPLTTRNIPLDYRPQAEQLLEFFASRDVAHNDLWKADPRMRTLYKVEFLVSSGGRLRAIDFNTGTVNGSYACVPGGRTTALKAFLERYFTPTSDGDVLKVLDAMFLANRTLESYAAKNITAMHGVCSLDLVLRNNRGELLTEVAKYHSQDNGTCKDHTATAKGGEFGIAFKAHHSAHQSMATARYLPNGVNLPSTANVRACVERCAACSECAAVSVSTARRACLWSKQPCVPIDSSRSLRTVYGRMGKPTIPLDDFVTVELRGGDRAAAPIASVDGLLAGFFAYRSYAGGADTGEGAAKSKWSWRGLDQDSHTLLSLAAKPISGTTRALQHGRRHVNARLSLIESRLSLKGKSVLELGSSNLGMNLLELRGSLSWGVGCDVNPVAVNQANYLASVLDVGKAFRFYTVNLNEEPASILRTFLPGGRADVVFIFSVNAYVTDFAKLLDTLEASVAPSTFVIELNALGDDVAAIEREASRLRSRPRFASVIEITDYTACADCKLNKGRLFLCTATPSSQQHS